MRSRTNFRLPVACGAKKKRRHVTETDLGGKIAKAGDQGQSSSLASSSQWKDGWSCWRSKSNRWDERLDDTTSSNSTEQAFWYKSDTPSCEMEHNGYFGATEAAMTTGCVCFTFDSRGQSQKRLPHADRHLIQGEMSRARSRNEKKGVWRRSYKSRVRHLEEVKANLTKKRGMNWTLEERELDDFWNARAEWRHQLSDAIPSGTCEAMSGRCGQTSPQRRTLVYSPSNGCFQRDVSWMWILATWKKASGGWPRLKITLMRCSGGRHHMRQNADAIWEAFEFTVRKEGSNWKKAPQPFWCYVFAFLVWRLFSSLSCLLTVVFETCVGPWISPRLNLFYARQPGCALERSSSSGASRLRSQGSLPPKG